MLREFWELHRAKICAAAGAAVFIASGAVVSLMPPAQNDEPPAQIQQEQERYAQPKKTKYERKAEPAAAPATPSPVRQSVAPSPKVELTVYITGHVKNPGIYRLPANSRVETLIGAAGGFMALADREAVNMAKPLEDGAHVHVPYKWAAQDKKVSNSDTSTKSKSKSKSKPTKSKERVDINHADTETLTKLHGIGPVLARRIVEYRQAHGPFRSVDELINVNGIGKAKLDGMRGQAFVTP